MKHMLRKLAVVCLLAILCIGVVKVPAKAETLTNALGGLTYVRYYDTEKKAPADKYIYPAVLFQYKDQDYAVTEMPVPTASNIIAVVHTESGYLFPLQYAATYEEDGTILYYVIGSKGEADYIHQMGNLVVGQKISFNAYKEQNGNLAKRVVGYRTVKSVRDDGRIELSSRMDLQIYPSLILNINNEPVGFLIRSGAYSFNSDLIVESYGKSEEKKKDEEVPETQPIKFADDLPTDSELYPTVKTESHTVRNMLIIVGIAVVVIGLTVAIILIFRKGKKNEVARMAVEPIEEGTRMVEPQEIDTGLRFQFRSGRRIAVRKNFTIGRAPDNDVAVAPSSTAVSMHHCEILVEGDQAFLRDLSSNGTYINGMRVPKGQPIQLQVGMRVGLGSINSVEAFDVVLSSKFMNR